jgi:hypothetical protein
LKIGQARQKTSAVLPLVIRPLYSTPANLKT